VFCFTPDHQKRPIGLKPAGLGMQVTKGEKTRDFILHHAAILFNTRGYANTSISDLMSATGLKKGGIYNHFTTKNELALQAFDYAFTLVKQRIRRAIASQEATSGRLQNIISVYEDFFRNPPIPGGCPILNAAIELDDASNHPLLHRRVKKAMDFSQN